MAQALVHLPPRIVRGSVVEVRCTLAHPMETGHRRDSAGTLLPRDIVTRFECRLDDALVFEADLHPAIAANPYLAFTLRAGLDGQGEGELRLLWLGDRGFRHEERRRLAFA